MYVLCVCVCVSRLSCSFTRSRCTESAEKERKSSPATRSRRRREWLRQRGWREEWASSAAITYTAAIIIQLAMQYSNSIQICVILKALLTVCEVPRRLQVLRLIKIDICDRLIACCHAHNPNIIAFSVWPKVSLLDHFCQVKPTVSPPFSFHLTHPAPVGNHEPRWAERWGPAHSHRSRRRRRIHLFFWGSFPARQRGHWSHRLTGEGRQF